MTDVWTNVTIGSAAAHAAAVAASLDTAVSTARTWRGVERVDVEKPPTVVGPDIYLSLRTTGIGAEAVLDLVANAFPRHQVRAAYVGSVYPYDPPSGRYVFNEDSPGKTSSEPIMPATAAHLPTATLEPLATAEGAWSETPPTPRPYSVMPEAAAPRSPPDVADMGILTLVGELNSLSFNITTRINARGVRSLGADSRFWDTDLQVTLERDSIGWKVIPNVAAPNDTFLNGRVITAAATLTEGDVLAVGRQSKGIIKMPLRVRVGSAE